MTSVPFLNRSSRGQATAAAVAAAVAPSPAVMTSQYGTNSVRPHADPLARGGHRGPARPRQARRPIGARPAARTLHSRAAPLGARAAAAIGARHGRHRRHGAGHRLAALRRLEVFEARHQGALQAYLRTAVMNRIRDVIRQRDRRPLQGEMPEDLLDDGDVAARAADRRAERQLLRGGARTPALERSRGDRRPHRDAIQLRRARHRAEQTDGERGASGGRARAETPGRRDAQPCQLRM